MTGIKRNYVDKILKLLEFFPAVSIIGARQVGKTTLARQVSPDWKYIDLENLMDLERIQYDPNFFFNQYPNKLIIDEAQSYPDIFKILRSVIDKNREEKGRFILTGSSSAELLSHVSESLAGRIAIVEVGTFKANEYYEKPLSPFYELFNGKLDKPIIENIAVTLSNIQMQKLWLVGGYPEPLLQNNSQYHNQWMQNYINTYINRDIAKLFPKLNKFAFQRFINILSKLSSTILNKSDLARSIEVSEGTIREYISITAGTFLWRMLPSFEKNIIKSIIKMPKGHLTDSGLLHFLLRINTLEELYQNPIVGHSFEAFVIEEIIKGLNATMVTNWKSYYYRTRNGAEIDLILDGHFGTLPIEIKYGSTVSLKQLTALSQFIEEHNLPFGLVINQSEQIEWLTAKVLQLPVGCL